MPSPIGHTLAGCAVALALIPPELLHGWEPWALCLISANVPDSDFIPGLLAGKPRTFHRGPSHSMMAAFMAAGLGALLVTWPSMPWLTQAGLIFLAYGSHVGLDYFTPGRGVLLGWPFSRRRYQAVRPWFLSVSVRTIHQASWGRSGGRHLLWAIGREVLLVAPGVAVVALVRGLGWLPLGTFPG
jgi:membrane-bound metal-dependent hydrolase YbcI (DUF457 family)